MSLPLPLEPGTQLGGQYIVGALINSGGFGAVYRGTDTSENDRPCAIKETYDVSPAARRRALVEASVLFTVNSKHLPRVYDAFEANGRFYLVMQLIEGQNLQQLLSKRVAATGQPFTDQQVLAWLLPVMQTLQELHGRSPAVIHRDIKPANIILTPERTAVLVDFGLTRLYEVEKSGQTGARAVSEGFSPIEQYLGRTTPQSDIYALAATMYTLLTNKLPPSALSRSMQDDLVSPCLCNPAISPQVERALLKALSLQAEDRYQNMADFARALQEPPFTAYSDPTLAAPPIPPPPPPLAVLPASPPRTSSLAPTLANPAPKRGRGRAQRGNGQQVPQSPPMGGRGRAGAVPPMPVTVPPGYVLVPQSALAPQKPLPSATGQGCLWGLLQGVLSALLLLLVKKEASFYVGILMGLLFYLVAGYFTTRRGGNAVRGGWAGLWAGFVSTLTFWIVLLIGLLIQLTNRINADERAARLHGGNVPQNEIQRAWQAVMPTFSSHPAAQSPPPQTQLLIFLLAGIVFAFLSGLLGGFLGRSRHRVRLQKRAKPVLKNA